MKQKTESKEPTVPSIKSTLPPEQWNKRVESRIYRRKIGQFVRLLKTLDPLGRKLTRETKDIAHYFLDVATVEESRRMRSPSERLSDSQKAGADSAPKQSLAY